MSVWWNFVGMSLFFGMNHATASAIIPLAVGQFGDALGSASLSCLYLSYTLSAMTSATYIVDKLGDKWALVAGCLGYCTYYPDVIHVVNPMTVL